MPLRLFPVLLLASSLIAGDWYLFTSFRRNGETGVFLSLSSDGHTWTPLNGNRPWLKPEFEGMLMRDPWLERGPDETWRMLWTWGWTRDRQALRIGYAESKDLLRWSPQRAIPVMTGEPTARNAWAPEAAWDPTRREWVIFWSSTIPGRFPKTDDSGDNGYNHRLYGMTTRDWTSFSPSRLLFDPGFNCIDATLLRDGKRWVMVFKDERKTPLQKRLRVAFANSPAGPWGQFGEPFSPDWVEGPSVARIGPDWFIYFDHYRQPRHYGAMHTRDWKRFESVEVRFPEDHRHGTVVPIPEALAKRLQAANRP